MGKEERKHTIRALNDRLRILGEGGQIIVAGGLASAPRFNQLIALSLIQAFNNFDEGDDPYHEHDFGKVHSNALERDFYFKIDYYNPTLDGGSEDPADPAKTTRIMTIFYAEDY